MVHGVAALESDLGPLTALRIKGRRAFGQRQRLQVPILRPGPHGGEPARSSGISLLINRDGCLRVSEARRAPAGSQIPTPPAADITLH